MSFALTTPQFLDGSKTVTRRTGWWFLRPGDKVRAVKKSMGLKKGEKIEQLGIIEIVSTRAELLRDIHADDCRREGFPNFSPAEFCAMLCAHYGITPDAVFNRIEFRRVA